MRSTLHGTIFTLAVLAVLSSACASTDSRPQQAEPEELIERSTVDRVALVETVFLASPSRLELGVIHGSCDDLVPSLTETAERVEIAVHNPVPAGTDCSDEGRITVMDLDLAAPLGGRQVVIEVAPHVLDGATRNPATCFFGPDKDWCQQVTISSGGTERTIGAPDYPPTGVGVSLPKGTTSLELSSGMTVEISTDTTIDRPYFLELRSLWQPDREISGSLNVHNVNRPLTDAEPLDREVAGFPAYWVTPPQSANEPPDTVAVRLEQWSIDISLWTSDPTDQRDILNAFLDTLEIEQRPGQFPSVVDTNGCASPTSELTITNELQHGLTFAVAPNCEPDQDFCRPGLGFVSPATPVLLQTAGVDDLRFPELDEEDPTNPPLDGLDLNVADFGPLNQLLTCTGVPAFDTSLLPQGVTSCQ